MRENININEMFKEYANYKMLFDKHGIRIEAIVGFTEGGGKITQIHEYYEKEETARGFSKKPTRTEIEEVTARHYLNFCTWIGAYMGVRVTGKTYTPCGNIPTRMTSVRPDGNAKSITYFKFAD